MTTSRKVSILAVVAVGGLLLATLCKLPGATFAGVAIAAAAGVGLALLGIGEARRG